MKIAYGHQIETDDDEYIKMTENVSLAHVDAGDPGTAPVDFFPSCTLLASLRLADVGYKCCSPRYSAILAVVVPGLLVQPCRPQ